MAEFVKKTSKMSLNPQPSQVSVPSYARRYSHSFLILCHRRDHLETDRSIGIQATEIPNPSLPLLLSRVFTRPRGRAPRSMSGSIRASPSGLGLSALGSVFVGTHEVHPVHRDVLLLDGLLHALLVLPEALGARVAAAVPLQELLSEPAVETLVVLPLQVGTRLADAVHLRRPTEILTRRRNVEDLLRSSSPQRHTPATSLSQSRDRIKSELSLWKLK